MSSTQNPFTWWRRRSRLVVSLNLAWYYGGYWKQNRVWGNSDTVPIFRRNRRHQYRGFDCDHAGPFGKGQVCQYSVADFKTVDECIEMYTKLSKELFITDRVFVGKIPIGDNQCRFDFNTLEMKVKDLVEQKLGNKDHIMSEKPVEPTDTLQRHTFVVARMADNVTARPTIFRSYPVEGILGSKCAIWQAARATTAAPSFFKPMTIEKPLPSISYVDGGLGYNNPSKLALQEARRIWGRDKRFCLVSIGTGQQSAKTVVDPTQLETELETQLSVFETLRSSLTASAS